jgi:hypothetical protein
MSETCAGYLRRVLPDTVRIVELVREALDETNSSVRVYTLGTAVGQAQKLTEDLQRAEAAARAEA